MGQKFNPSFCFLYSFRIPVTNIQKEKIFNTMMEVIIVHVGELSCCGKQQKCNRDAVRTIKSSSHWEYPVTNSHEICINECNQVQNDFKATNMWAMQVCHNKRTTKNIKYILRNFNY